MKKYIKPITEITILIPEQTILGTSMNVGTTGVTGDMIKAADRFDWDDELPEEDE